MKHLARVGLAFFNIMVIVIIVCMAAYSYDAWQNDQMTFSQFLVNLVVYFAIWRVTRSRWVQSLLCRIFGLDPMKGIFEEKRRFSAWYDAIAAQNARKEAARRAAAAEEARRAANAAAYARYDARNKAAFHEYQARQQAGTYSGYQHENLARKYREDAKR